mmetsp:Transcript_17939/g.27144  ORF Transcript_17939/g.27144 Transcript_17939/m.27144 type:complete len:450 (+) Transcript_17939:46-1395(+)
MTMTMTTTATTTSHVSTLSTSNTHSCSNNSSLRMTIQTSLQHVLFLMIMCLVISSSSAFPLNSNNNHHKCISSVHSTTTALYSSSIDPRQLLYQDQQQAMHRRALHEEELLLQSSSKKNNKLQELRAPKSIKVSSVQSGTGFGGGSGIATKKTQQARLAESQAKLLEKDGVLRINQVLQPDTADALRDYVLQQQSVAQQITEDNPLLARTFYGVEQGRKHRCDLQLSLLCGGYAVDDDDTDGSSTTTTHALADALQELLGSKGTLRSIYEELVTLDGELYELAAVVTDPGSDRQIVHPDLPFQYPAPLYVIFLALQDVTPDMGPTSFLLGTHTEEQNRIFNSNTDDKDEQLKNAKCRLATLKKGDAVLFDARILHCGNANQSTKSRGLFNFSFRNPQVTGNLGYEGSIRPGYCEQMTLRDVSQALEEYEKGEANNNNVDPFAKYGSGVL